MYVAEVVEGLLLEVHSGNFPATSFAATKKEIVIHSLYYDFFTKQSSLQSSIHFRLMVKLTGNHSKPYSADFPIL